MGPRGLMNKINVAVWSISFPYLYCHVSYWYYSYRGWFGDISNDTFTYNDR